MIDQRLATDFLDGHRIALVGASDDPKSFATTIHRALLDHHYDVVAVNPRRDSVSGRACYPTVSAVPGEVDGVIVMVPAASAADVVADAVTKGVQRVWLFKGLGSEGAVSDEAVARCRAHGVDVVAGACP